MENNNLINSSLYKKISENLPICTVDIIFFNKNKDKTLLFYRNNNPLKNTYFSCGGRLFKNEKFEDCAQRKAKEELGIEIKKNKLLFGSVINEIFNNSIYENINYHSVNIYYGYIITDDIENSINFDKQHKHYKWHKANDRNIHPLLKEKIKTLLKKYDQIN